MNRMKYRLCLGLLLLAAVAAGVGYYAWEQKQKQTVTDGTFVEYETEPEEAGAA